MSIHPAILDAFPDVSEQQQASIAKTEGPVLVIAGPGSGKSFCLVLRTLNILMQGLAEPREIVLCTFTNKAAFELRDRVASAARTVGFSTDLSSLRVGTIHAICNQLLQEHRHHTPLGNGYSTLDELTELLFVYDHFTEIVGEDATAPYFGRWAGKWTTIRQLRDRFSKLTEELIDVSQLQKSGDTFLVPLSEAYGRYREALFANNRVDFAHQQRLVHDLMDDAEFRSRVSGAIKYVMVDEYQDTNYVQEQLLLRLASSSGNICVVGDEDQSLYRFRGATVRNILEFPKHFEDCPVLQLTTNYRSHRSIVNAYDTWMASANWSGSDGRRFRYDKRIVPDDDAQHPDYPAVFCIWGADARDEAERFADLVAHLYSSGVISDFNQVALLLHSVKRAVSGPYIEALSRRGIPAFCPRARAFFDNDEVRLMVGCLALIFGYHGDGRGDVTQPAMQGIASYADGCLQDLAQACAPPHPLADELQNLTTIVESLAPDDSLDLRPADFFYRLLAMPPFSEFVFDENRARNLAVLSQLLNTFQEYHHFTVVTGRNREALRFRLFSSFFRLLVEDGINEYEDPEQPFPSGYVQIMTIHQGKGLEFPVVVVGSLATGAKTAKQVDRELGPYYRRPPFEPESRITGFDRMRLHYVAFSRAEKVLVLTTGKQPLGHFATIWGGLPQWPYVERSLLEAQTFEPRVREPAKRSFSFTGDLMVYETCPRQYQFFRDYDFTPSRSAVIFFGLLVHQTIEEVHRRVLDGRASELSDEHIADLFESTFAFLALQDVRPIGRDAKRAALRQVLNYVHQNEDAMQRVLETEVDVSVEKDDYILMGKVDLLLGGDGKLELLDFKSSARPPDDARVLAGYQRQLCTYAHILEQRYGKRADRLYLYWTGEARREDALMSMPYGTESVQAAGAHFDHVVGRIKRAEFGVPEPPETSVCKECDLRGLCSRDGTLSQREGS